MLISIEGIDGAGKNTVTQRLRKELDCDVSVLSFPRYEESIHAQLAQQALYGKMGDLIDSAYGMATLFALDRCGAKEQLLAAAEDPGSLLILDRYVASNAAYTAARLSEESVVDWIYELSLSALACRFRSCRFSSIPTLPSLGSVPCPALLTTNAAAETVTSAMPGCRPAQRQPTGASRSRRGQDGGSPPRMPI